MKSCGTAWSFLSWFKKEDSDGLVMFLGETKTIVSMFFFRLEVYGRRLPGRPRKTWKQVIERDMRAKGLKEAMTGNR